jgi:RNA polymerase sigma-70 factor (ECF subfamily)
VPSDHAALAQIYREHRQQLFTCALAVTRCPERAEDAIQEVFCRLFGTSVRPRKLKAYVFRAVRNAALDQVVRNPACSQALPEFVFDAGPEPADAMTEGELKRQVAAALVSLAPDECETIVQHLYGGLTFREIAEVRQTPLGTVTSWYRRGLEKLRAKLEE